ncbi:MAG: hypothetical protein ABEH40_04905 [Haloferacaceae archaeon]
MPGRRPRDPGTFHVVCHDCTHERVTADDEEAATLVHEHATDTGHAVESERVA